MKRSSLSIFDQFQKIIYRAGFFFQVTLTYIHTLRYLTFIQIAYRIWYYFYSVKVSESAHFDINEKNHDWVPSAKRARSMLGDGEFIFYGKIGKLEEIGWDGEGQDKLWRYLQNYFDDLNAVSAKKRGRWHTNLMKKWVLQNPPAEGVGWEPYPTSIRIVNWVKWSLQGNDLPTECQESLFIQARYLRKRLEWHLMGNHVFANAKALLFAGLYFECSEAKSWFDFGLRVINQQLEEQVLPDGAHFELSPSYQILFIEDLLDLLNVSQVFGGAVDKSTTSRWRNKTCEMILWLKEMLHDDGEISYFNDSHLGINPPVRELLHYARRMGLYSEKTKKFSEKQSVKELGWARLTYLNSSGYVRLKTKVATAILDCAEIGASYQPGHAHADTLSFELSLFGRRVFVNCGTSTYNNNATRHAERATQSHTTLEFNHKSSSEVWSAFRVARRAFPSKVSIENKGKALEVSCFHDGYARLFRPARHQRIWSLEKNKLRVTDNLYADHKQFVVRYHLHPELTLKKVSHNSFEVTFGSQCLALIKITKGVAKIDASHYAPTFGSRSLTVCLAVYPQEFNGVEVEISWDD